MIVFLINSFMNSKVFKTKELAEKYIDLNYKDYPELKESIKEIEVIESLEEKKWLK